MPKTKTMAKAMAGKKPAKMSNKKSSASKGGMKKADRKKPRMRPGTGTLREIRRYQKSLSMLLPRASFQRLVRQVASDCGGAGLRF